MTKKEQKAALDILMQKIYDFFWIHMDEFTAKTVKKNPDTAIPVIRDWMKSHHIKMNKLVIFKESLADIVEYNRVKTILRAV